MTHVIDEEALEVAKAALHKQYGVHAVEFLKTGIQAYMDALPQQHQPDYESLVTAKEAEIEQLSNRAHGLEKESGDRKEGVMSFETIGRWWRTFEQRAKEIDPAATQQEIVAAGNWIRLNQFLKKLNPHFVDTPPLIEKMIKAGFFVRKEKKEEGL